MRAKLGLGASDDDRRVLAVLAYPDGTGRDGTGRDADEPRARPVGGIPLAREPGPG
ncbi:hypothetical protein [Kitasatospora brasiliensis]|uniref:hypothetical protein n=1 Tax=Kitasatospora brasiliensis TaxID=3058040 RepID=UPI00292EBEE2|nr:hypothetical protein [Kitasatospora sp. K002]